MTSYLIIGNGRLAKHFAHYLRLLDLSVQTWSRAFNTAEELQTFATHADRILLLISDDQIESFVQSHPFLLKKRLVHASGALTFSFADSAHPLNTFGADLYNLDVYLKTPFIVEAEGSGFSDILPGLKNPHFTLPREKKALYHALCVASGNFTTLLWQNVFESFENDLHLPASALLPYLERVAANLANSSSAALTGPIARGDTKTIVRNLDALRNRPEQALYYAFLHFVLAKKNRLGDLEYERLDV
jgi:2-dehydropantoate 2-reductase